MNRINQILLFLFLLSNINGHSQKKYLDFIVTQKNDTIYGTIQEKMNGKVLFEKNSNPEKDGIKYYSHKLKNLKSLRLNDQLYQYEKSDEDGIYAETTKQNNDTTNFITTRIKDYVNTKIRLKDYVITITKDTIYGVIKKPFFGKPYIATNKNTIKIENPTIKEYRYSNKVYQYIEKKKVDIFDRKNAYLKLIFDGNIKLYEYKIISKNSQISVEKKYYFILKNNILNLIRDLNYKTTLSEIFADNSALISKIMDDEYTLDNIYLMVKFYNDEK